MNLSKTTFMQVTIGHRNGALISFPEHHYEHSLCKITQCQNTVYLLQVSLQAIFQGTREFIKLSVETTRPITMNTNKNHMRNVD